MLESWLKWTKSKLLCFSSEAEQGGGHEANCPRLKGAATIRSILESWLSGRKRLTANEVGVYSSSRVRIPHSPPGITFRKIKVGSLGAKRLGMVFPRENPSIFEGERKRPLGNAEVRTNLFEKIQNPFGIFLLSVFFGLVGLF